MSRGIAGSLWCTRALPWRRRGGARVAARPRAAVSAPTYPPAASYRPRHGAQRCGCIGDFKRAWKTVLLRGFGAGFTAVREDVRAVQAAAVLKPGVDDVEGPPSERQHVGFALLGVGGLSRQYPRLAVEVRPGRSGELLLAGAAQVRELKEVA
jgi:hypothetical protein